MTGAITVTAAAYSNSCRKNLVLSIPCALAKTSAPFVENGLTSTMVDDTARAATKPTALTPLPPCRKGTAERDDRAQHRRGGSEGRDDGADDAQQQRRDQRRRETGDAVADVIDGAHGGQHADVGADPGDEQDLRPRDLPDGPLLRMR